MCSGSTSNVSAPVAATSTSRDRSSPHAATGESAGSATIAASTRPAHSAATRRQSHRTAAASAAQSPSPASASARPTRVTMTSSAPWCSQLSAAAASQSAARRRSSRANSLAPPSACASRRQGPAASPGGPACHSACASRSPTAGRSKERDRVATAQRMLRSCSRWPARKVPNATNSESASSTGHSAWRHSTSLALCSVPVTVHCGNIKKPPAPANTKRETATSRGTPRRQQKSQKRKNKPKTNDTESVFNRAADQCRSA